MPLKTAGSRGWNMWAPSIGLTFKTISTTCRETERGRRGDMTKGTAVKENPERETKKKRVCKKNGSNEL